MQSFLSAFGTELRASLGSLAPAVAVREMLRRTMVATGPPLEEDLVRIIAERIDVSPNDDRLLSLTADVAALIESIDAEPEVAQLLEVIAERSRTVVVIRRYLGRTITRTAFLSFIASQRWPRDIKDRMQNLSKEELHRIAEALERLELDVVGEVLLV